MIYIFDVPFSEVSIYAPSPIYVLRKLLKNNGSSNVTKDLNLLFVKYLFEKKTLKKYFEKDKIFWDFLKENNISPQELKSYIFKELRLLLKMQIGKIDTLEQLVDFNFDTYLENPNSPLVYFISDKLNFIKEKETNMYLISIRYNINLFSGLLIAKYTKNIDKNSRIILGGSYFIVTTNENIKYILEKFNCVEYISNGQAETNLLDLVGNILHNKKDFSRISNLFFRNNKDIVFTYSKYPEFLENIFIEKRKFKEYFEPREVPVNNGLGCYWNRCVYCNFQKLKKQMIISSQKVVDFLEDSIHGLNSTLFSLNTECLRQKDFIELSKEIIKRKLHKKIKNIISFCKPDNFNANIFTEIGSARINKIVFGVEAFSDNLLKKMRKGTNSKIIINDIKGAHKASMFVQVNLIYDFPGINKVDIKKNIYTLYLLSEDIDNLAYSSFELLNKTYIFYHPEEFNISINSNLIPKHYINKIPFNKINDDNNAIIDYYYLFMLKIFKKYFTNKKIIKRNIATYNYCTNHKLEMKFVLCNFIVSGDKNLFVFEKDESILGAILNKEMIEFLKRYDRKQNFTMININNQNSVIKRFIQFCIKENLVVLDNKLVDENEYNKITFRDYEQLYEDEIPKQTIF